MKVWAAAAVAVMTMPTLDTCAASQIQAVMHPTSTAECGAISACGRLSPNLKLTISPDRGPRGTVVTVKVTGCNDPHGDNHTLSYGDGMPHLTAIPTTQDGETLTARFRVTSAVGPAGSFVVQCSRSEARHTFTVTG